MIGAPFGGLKVIVSENTLETTTTRVRTYPKRKAKSESHWRRMDKKWRKRYGFKKVPCMYRFGSNHLICHPSLYAKLRASLGESEL